MDEAKEGTPATVTSRARPQRVRVRLVQAGCCLTVLQLHRCRGGLTRTVGNSAPTARNAFVSAPAAIDHPEVSSRSPDASQPTQPADLGGSSIALGAGVAAFGAALRHRRKVRCSASSQTESDTATKVEDAVATTDVGKAADIDVEIQGGAAVAKARPWFRMWTRADFWHVHAVTGTIEILIGVLYLLDVAVGDIFRLSGMSWSPLVPLEAVYLSLILGAVNGLSGLQPTLLPRPFDDFMQLLGLGENGNLKSGGFVNTAVFYFILAHQCIRVSPDFPTWLQAFDPIFASVAILGLFHAIGIIYAWVGRGKLSAGFAFGMASTLCLNLPVSLHLLFEGQSWVEKLSAAFPGWPEVFFSANYALAWAGATVSLVLSLYERRVIDITERLLLTVLIGAIVFGVIGLQAALLVPEWFSEQQYMVMLTLTPP